MIGLNAGLHGERTKVSWRLCMVSVQVNLGCFEVWSSDYGGPVQKVAPLLISDQ